MSLWQTIVRGPRQDTPVSYSGDLKDNAPGSQYQLGDSMSGLAGTGGLTAASLDPLANLSRDTLDYLSLDDAVLSDLPGAQSVLPSRGWSDDLCYGVGITYCSALGIGGAWGLAEGLNRLPPTAPPKLRLNAALNAMTRRGPFLGNSAGVIALVYNGVNSTIGYYRGRHDALNSVTAGFVSGALFKSTRGPRQMLISGGLVSLVAATWTGMRRWLL